MSEVTKKELDGLRLRMRHAGRSSAIPLNQGTDEELEEARSKMPEPTRHKLDFYQVRLSGHEVPFWPPSEMPISEPLRAACFVRVLVKSREGATFYAWQHNGRHYL